MNLKACVPLLNVLDGKRSIDFYCDSLGFEVVAEAKDDDGMHWATVRNGSDRIMINQRGEAASDDRASSRSFRGAVLYFEVESVHDLHLDLKARGLPVSEPEAMPYGVDECYLRDPDGYELAFTSPRRS